MLILIHCYASYFKKKVAISLNCQCVMYIGWLWATSRADHNHHIELLGNPAWEVSENHEYYYQVVNYADFCLVLDKSSAEDRGLLSPRTRRGRGLRPNVRGRGLRGPRTQKTVLEARTRTRTVLEDYNTDVHCQLHVNYFVLPWKIPEKNTPDDH